MKSNYVNANSLETVFRNLFFALLVLVISAAGAHAQVVQASYKSPAVIEPVITYLGSGDEQMSFNMKYDNAGGDKLLVTVKDENGEALFSQVFTDKKFNKTFKVPADIGNLSFELRNLKSKAQKKIEINTERHYVEEVSVTRVY